MISKNNLLKSKLYLFIIIFILILGLIWNFYAINQNYNRFSYAGSDSRYGIMKNLSEDFNFPLVDEIDNYRFGTTKYLFGETINYFMPRVSQTFGYQDAGMLNEPRYYDMRWHIWISDDVEDSIYWLDWFGIKYFIVTEEDADDNFRNKFDDERFRLVEDYYFSGYSFTLYEYLEAKKIVSLVENLDGDKIGNEKEFYFERNHPDKIILSYNECDSDDVILFKEFFHKNWKAKDLNGEILEVLEVGPGFMGVYPKEDSKGVIFYYQKNLFEYFCILLSLVTFISLLIFLIRDLHHEKSY